MRPRWGRGGRRGAGGPGYPPNRARRPRISREIEHEKSLIYIARWWWELRAASEGMVVFRS